MGGTVKKVFSQGLLGKALGWGKSDAPKDNSAQLRQQREVQSSRQKSDAQAEEARSAGSRKSKRGRRLFVDDRSTLG